MKTFLLLLVLTGAGSALKAQTNTPPLQTNTSARAAAETHIFSDDGVHFDLKTHMAVYRGHVRVDDPKMRLTCETMTANVPEAGGRIDSIVAEQNVVIETLDEKGQTNRATADKAVYTYKVAGSVTNETVELTGNPLLEWPQGTMRGDPIVWDRINNQVRAWHRTETVIRSSPAEKTNVVVKPQVK